MEKICKQCQKAFSVSSRHGAKVFCGRSCSGTYNNSRRIVSEEHKKNTSEGLKRSYTKKVIATGIALLKDTNITKICPTCKLEFTTKGRVKNQRQHCSKKCAYSGEMQRENSKRSGRISALVQVRRSKDEIKLCSLCEEHFSLVLNNSPVVDTWDADIILPDRKVAILWNGIWHREQLSFKNHHLNQVKARDEYKIRLFEKNGWRVIVFEDNEWTPTSAFEWLKSEFDVDPVRFERTTR